MEVRPPAARLLPTALVIITIVLQLLAAWLLSSAAKRPTFPGDQGFGVRWMVAALAVGCAVGLNIFRFVIWGYMHKRYPLSHTYPLTALFFPCVLILSALQGHPVGTWEVWGTLLITGGAMLLGAGSQGDEHA